MVHKLECNTILFYGDFLLVTRTDGSKNLIAIPLIYEFVYTLTCETHKYCNSRFQTYKGLLTRLQSYLNKRQTQRFQDCNNNLPGLFLFYFIFT